MNSIMPGVTKLLDRGFVDRDNLALQGHSWGGYQIAFMVTRTNMFKAGAPGAPVAT
jgi:dipeptidyl aminopeptidase/acylaminoacyl peptidase